MKDFHHGASTTLLLECPRDLFEACILFVFIKLIKGLLQKVFFIKLERDYCKKFFLGAFVPDDAGNVLDRDAEREGCDDHAGDDQHSSHLFLVRVLEPILKTFCPNLLVPWVEALV